MKWGRALPVPAIGSAPPIRTYVTSKGRDLESIPLTLFPPAEHARRTYPWANINYTINDILTAEPLSSTC